MPVSKSGGHLVEEFTPRIHKVDWVKVSDDINQGSGGYHYERERKDWRYVLMAELVKFWRYVNGHRFPCLFQEQDNLKYNAQRGL